MLALREYQRELLKQVQTALGPRQARVMAQLPTGGGKTIVAAHLLADWLAGWTRGRLAHPPQRVGRPDVQNADRGPPSSQE